MQSICRGYRHIISFHFTYRSRHFELVPYLLLTIHLIEHAVYQICLLLKFLECLSMSCIDIGDIDGGCLSFLVS